MLRILTLGDPHFKKNNRLQTEALQREFIDVIKKECPDLVVVMGDTLHTFNNVDTRVLVPAVEFMESIAELVPLYLLVGNHDLPNNYDFMSGIHGFTALRKWENTVVVDKTVSIVMKDIRLTMVPYVKVGMLVEALDKEPLWKESAMIFAHPEIMGVQLGGIVSTNGDVWLPEYPLLAAGHVHDYSKPQDNVTYVGTAIQHASNESTKKTVSIFEIDENKKIKEVRIELPIPKRLIYKVKAADVQKLKVEDGIVKIIITGTVSENQSAGKLRIVKKWREKGYQVVFKYIKEASDEREDLDFNNKSYQELLKEQILKREDKNLMDAYLEVCNK